MLSRFKSIRFPKPVNRFVRIFSVRLLITITQHGQRVKTAENMLKKKNCLMTLNGN